MWLKKNRNKIILAALAIGVLAGAFYWGGSAPGARGWTVNDPVSAQPSASAADTAPTAPEAPEPAEEADSTSGTDTAAGGTDEVLPEAAPGAVSEQTGEQTPELSPQPAEDTAQETGKDPYLTDPVPQGKPLPVEPEDAVSAAEAYTCTLSISCGTILDNMDLCGPEKAELVPEDGWILPATTVTFYRGESVFDVLQRTCQQLEIHLEFANTPIYNSAYIEGIHNLYEFDVGEESGWMYAVNDWFPNYGCSRYQLQDGDAIRWVYTCDLGRDVGGGYAADG